MSLSQENKGGDSESLRSQSAFCTSKSYLFKSQLHTNKLLKELHCMRKENILCNITFNAGDTKIHAHRAVLASCSPYFRTLFVTNISDQINFDGVESKILEQVIDYLYSGEIQLMEQDVTATLSIAHTLEITEVVDACFDFLVKQVLIPSKCFSIRALVKHYEFNSLKSKLDSYIRDHFSQVIEEKEYLNLPMDDISDLIQDDNLVISDETEVFSCVMNWVKYDIENRKSFLPSLMKHIRLPLVKQEFLEQKLKEERLIREIPECLDDVKDTLSYIQQNKDQDITNTSKRTTPRQSFDHKILKTRPDLWTVAQNSALKEISPMTKIIAYADDTVVVTQASSRRKLEEKSQEMAIIVIDTWSLHVKRYEFRSCKWMSLNEIPTKRPYSAIAMADERLYVLGGLQNKPVNTVDVYNTITDEWMEGVPMTSNRYSLRAASLNGKIYAVGGISTGVVPLNSAEVFDPESQSWKPIAPMLTPRQELGLVAVNNRLYAAGGYDGTNRSRTAEYYDPEANKWHFVSEMSCCRSGFNIGVLNGLLYAVGGWDGKNYLRSVDVYDPNTDSWRFVADMIHCRFSTGVIPHNDMLYAVAGRNRSIEVYCPKTDKWMLLQQEMPSISDYLLVSLINQPPRFV